MESMHVGERILALKEWQDYSHFWNKHSTVPKSELSFSPDAKTAHFSLENNPFASPLWENYLEG